jgi:hypothetical protein
LAEKLCPGLELRSEGSGKHKIPKIDEEEEKDEEVVVMVVRQRCQQ